MVFFLSLVVNGLMAGAIYALLALGFSLVYRTTGDLNFAQGESLMVGAVLGVFFIVTLGWPYWLAFAVVIVLGGVLGLVLQQVAYQPVRNASIITRILAIVAAAEIMRGIVRVIRGSNIAALPFFVDNSAVHIGSIAVSVVQLIIGAIAVVLVIAFAALLRSTRLGRAMRVVAQNREAASIVGVNVPVTVAWVWAIATALAAVVGLLFGPLVGVSPDMGGSIMVKGFIAAILGGFTSLEAAVAGGFLLGIVDNLVAGYLSASFRDVASLLVLLAVLWLRPEGLFVKASSGRV